MNINQLRAILIVAIAWASGACGQIPKEYRGVFVDQSAGFQMELRASQGTWIRPDGSKEIFPTRAVAIEELAQGQAGIYLRSINSNQLEVFWVRPNLQSRREEYGFIALEGEVVYARLEVGARRPISVILARHCARGQVLIDSISQTFNGGCPGDSKILELVRTMPNK